MVDHSTATTVEPIDLLRMQNLGLRFEVLNMEREKFGLEMVHKYGAHGTETLTVNADGTIVRPVTTE